MRVFLTGGTGFIGGEVARLLRERGDHVRALVRTPDKAAALTDLGCELVAGDLSDEDALREALRGCDALVHAAAVYEIGVPHSRREQLVDVNVCGTERVLGAALAAGVGKAVYVSTVAVFGDTGGAVADEDYRRPDGQGFTSVYEQTKVEAHQRARQIGGQGLPLVVVQPGVVYGPGDHSEVGGLFERLLKGRLPLMPFPGTGITPVHRDDVAAGILLALDKGAAGESYVLAGEPTTMGDLLAELARVAGKRPPRGALPALLVKAMAPVGPLVGPLLGFPPNLRELLSSSHGVTFWARSDKAQRELGWTYRPLAEGLATVVPR
ncbi:MAG TPA: NAD-dependent epimerase/dehydratase family protein [Mycobacteriales bacterium]|nr:NAD-dependent epimerase/dehydratase family protein [Mycobacteriales bacterium]